MEVDFVDVADYGKVVIMLHVRPLLLNQVPVRPAAE